MRRHSALSVCGPLRTLLVAPVLLAGLMSATGCESVTEAERFAPPTAALQSKQPLPPRPAPPRLETNTPTYPAVVLYILYREYLHKNPGLTSLSPEDPRYQQYLERRLRQLYPQKGYAGMMRDAVEEARRNRSAWLEYQRQVADWEAGIQACDGTTIYDPVTGEPCDGGTIDSSDPTTDPSWEGQEEFAVPADSFIPTLQQEIDSLQMDQPEIDRIYYQESLADGTFFEKRDELIVTSTGSRATIDDLIRAAGEGWMPGPGQVTIQVDEQGVAMVAISLAVIGWKAYRVVQAAQRARNMSHLYFLTLNYDYTKRDAHRHIFWNMQMNRYVGGYLAQLIANGWEQYRPGPAVAARMDYHNNTIGREVRYRSFRGHWLWDRWDWREWAVKVRDYINYAPNAEYIPQWYGLTQSESEALAREQQVPNWKYIYFSNDGNNQ